MQAGGKYQQCTFADKGQLNNSLTIAGGPETVASAMLDAVDR